MHELIAVIAAVRHAVQIPGQVVPRLETGEPLPAHGGEILDLPDGGVHPLGERRRFRDRRPGDGGVGLGEEPGVAEGAAAEASRTRYFHAEASERTTPKEIEVMPVSTPIIAAVGFTTT